MTAIPEDVRERAEAALDNMLCNCRESLGSTEAVRKASIDILAALILSEREAAQREGDASLRRKAQSYYEMLRECQVEFRARGATGLVETIEATMRAAAILQEPKE